MIEKYRMFNRILCTLVIVVLFIGFVPISNYSNASYDKKLVKNNRIEDVATPEPVGFMKGVDVSTLSKVEDHGGKFYDQGIQKDPLEIFTNYGANYARLKIWKDPVDSNGYNDLADTIEKAKRVKESGMKLLLNFHYSNFWADPGRQDKPVAWENLTFDELVQVVYDHTMETMLELKKAGITPDMVQVGNEIRPGMLFPDGRIENNDFTKLGELLNSGIQAVRDSAGGKDIKIMLHLDQGGDNGAYKWWFDGIMEAGVQDFQVIGASYYPYLHGTLDDLAYNLNDISSRYNKDVVVVETAYGFTLDDVDGHGNTFTEYEEGIGGYPATVGGQARFLYDLMEVVKNVPNERGLGVFYWEPAWLGVDGAGWKSGEGNAWENQAMFDFEGNALESLNIFTEGYVAPVPEPRPILPELPEEDPSLDGLIQHSLNKLATASSSAGMGGGMLNAPENAVDGDEYTAWGTDEGIGAWWKVDLNEVSSIERLMLHLWDGITQVKIEFSDDDEIYTTVGTFDITQSKMDLTLSDNPTGRYIKVTIIEASSNWVGFMQFNAYGAEEIAVHDEIAPVTEISIEGELLDGQYLGPVIINLTATDDQSGVAIIEYSLDNGGLLNTFEDEIKISKTGEYTILFRSIDNVGNVEIANELGFSIAVRETKENEKTGDVSDRKDSSGVLKNEKNDDGLKVIKSEKSEDNSLIIGKEDENQNNSKGSILPSTFTGMYNSFLVGIILITIGSVGYFLRFRKKKIKL